MIRADSSASLVMPRSPAVLEIIFAKQGIGQNEKRVEVKVICPISYEHSKGQMMHWSLLTQNPWQVFAHIEYYSFLHLLLLLSCWNSTLKCPCMAAQLQWTLLSVSHSFYNPKPEVHETGNMSFYQINTLHHGAGEGRTTLISMQTVYGLFNTIKTKIRIIKRFVEIFSEIIFYAPILHFVDLQAGFLTGSVVTGRSNKCRIWLQICFQTKENQRQGFLWIVAL